MHKKPERLLCKNFLKKLLTKPYRYGIMITVKRREQNKSSQQKGNDQYDVYNNSKQ